MALWHDRRGRFSYLRAGTLVMLGTPVLFTLYFALTNDLGPRPLTEAIHEIGLWTVRFLFVVLSITPLRRLARLPQLIDVRRMIGVGCFCYIALHFTLYIVDSSYNLAFVASEVVTRIYLTIGFTALTLLAVLAATSNDFMVRKLGQRWRKVHWLVYLIIVLACIHYFMQSKLEVFEPTVVAGLFGWLMLYRVMHWTLPRAWRPNGEFPVWVFAVLSVVTALLDFLLEAVGYWLVYGASPATILETDFDFSAGLRPGWYVLMGGLILTAIAWWRLPPKQPEPQPSSPVRAPQAATGR